MTMKFYDNEEENLKFKIKFIWMDQIQVNWNFKTEQGLR